MQHNDTTRRSKGQHLTYFERTEIQSMKRLGMSNRWIAAQLGRSHSTINDEIKRGTVVQKKLVNGKPFFFEDYYGETGQIVYERNREASKPRYKLVRIEKFIAYVQEKMQSNKWSPDVIVGRAIEEGTFTSQERVCAKTLYRYIDEGLIELTNLDLWAKVRRKSKTKRNRAHKRVLGQSIEARPLEINHRQTFGHWEIDTVIGKKTKDEPVLLTITERLSRYQIIIKLPGKNEAVVKEALEQISKDNPYFPLIFKSITADNGSEFASLSEALMDRSAVYFAHPFSSWERGTNEKHNGILRRFLPKGKSLKDVSLEQIQQITNWMNHLPRKLLKYRTPTEAILVHFSLIQATI